MNERLWEKMPLERARAWTNTNGLALVLFAKESDAWFFRGHVEATRERKRLYRKRVRK